MDDVDSLRVLSVEAMVQAERDTIIAGTTGAVLMERAGRAICNLILSRRGRGRAMVLAGPGNNGGDGYVVARLLMDAGWDVSIVSLGPVSALKGDAALMAAYWKGAAIAPEAARFDGWNIIIDALFGTGLTRPLTDKAFTLVDQANKAAAWKIAVDIPSGIAGNSGEVQGIGFCADDTVTFTARKPAHMLYPGRRYCGRVHVADIGISWRRGSRKAEALVHVNGWELFADSSKDPSLDNKFTAHKQAPWPNLCPLSGQGDRAVLLPRQGLCGGYGMHRQGGVYMGEKLPPA